MLEALETLKINATNGKENFCYINEKQLKAFKELAKREEEDIKKLNNIIDKLDKYIIEIYNSNYIIKDEHILQIWNKLQDLRSDNIEIYKNN